jgi:hypothetical protein
MLRWPARPVRSVVTAPSVLLCARRGEERGWDKRDRCCWCAQMTFCMDNVGDGLGTCGRGRRRWSWYLAWYAEAARMRHNVRGGRCSCRGDNAETDARRDGCGHVTHRRSVSWTTAESCPVRIAGRTGSIRARRRGPGDGPSLCNGCWEKPNNLHVISDWALSLEHNVVAFFNFNLYADALNIRFKPVTASYFHHLGRHISR